jgi:ATP-dependent RNA helicase DDX10/DBP4
MRAVHIQKDKTIFKVADLPAEEYAASMGLPGAPQFKFSESKGQARARGGAKKDEPEQPSVDTAVVANSDESEGEEDDQEEDEVQEDGENEAGQEDERESESDEGDDQSEEAGYRPVRAPEVRTKYDRMFERRNQSILTPHYSALVSHDENDAGDDVFTISRRDHALSDDEAGEGGNLELTDKQLVSSEDFSKRKLKAGASKKAQLKTRPAPEKLVFDEEGQARDFYESGLVAESGAAGQRAEFVEKERQKMKVADMHDREVAREKKREKKRKRKEREREVSHVNRRVAVRSVSDLKQLVGEFEDDGDGPLAMIGGDSDSEFGGSVRSHQEDDPPVVYKAERNHKRPRPDMVELEAEEALALRLLQGA